MDFLAVAMIVGSFLIFYGTIKFCDFVVKEQGGKNK